MSTRTLEDRVRRLEARNRPLRWTRREKILAAFVTVLLAFILLAVALNGVSWILASLGLEQWKFQAVNPSGKVLPGIIVSVYDEANQLAERCVTGQAGSCLLRVLFGAYHAAAVTAGYNATRIPLSVGFTLNTLVLNPTFSTVVQPGSMTLGVDYIFFTDSVSMFARNGTTGAISFTGTDPATVMNSAIAALPSAANKGGTIEVLAGYYNTVHTITISGVRQKLVFDPGVVWSHNAVDGSNAINIASTASSTVIEGGLIAGNAQDGEGLQIADNAISVTVRDSIFTAFHLDGVDIGAAFQIEFDRVSSTLNGRQGFRVAPISAGVPSQVWFVDSIGKQNTGASGYGLFVHGANNVNVVGGSYSDNTVGIHLENGNMGTLENVDVESNTGNGIELQAWTGFTVLDTDSGANTGFGIALVGATSAGLINDLVMTGNGNSNNYYTEPANFNVTFLHCNPTFNGHGTTRLGFLEIGDNLGFKISTPGVGGNGVDVQNTFPFPVLVYITGTGSGITAYGITDPYGTLTSFTTTVGVGWAIVVGPLAKIRLTYTGSPTWAWYGE